LDAELGQDLTVMASSDDQAGDDDNPLSGQTAALFTVRSEFPLAALGGAVIVASLPQSSQTAHVQARESRTGSTDLSLIDAFHASRSGHVDHGARDLVFSKLGQEQRDAELASDLFTAL